MKLSKTRTNNLDIHCRGAVARWSEHQTLNLGLSVSDSQSRTLNLGLSVSDSQNPVPNLLAAVTKLCQFLLLYVARSGNTCKSISCFCEYDQQGTTLLSLSFPLLQVQLSLIYFVLNISQFLNSLLVIILVLAEKST